MPIKRWGEFFLYLVRVFVLLILLAVLLPKLIIMCDRWLSSFFHYDQRPNGHPMRVEDPGRGEDVIQVVLDFQSDNSLKNKG